ncbi:MAG: NIPSNAP family protein [Balneolaceae bacterium]|nr:NIPSNAP family protein [Balneolaceae bacterium]MDR9409747.1 NIPSNAP family protein [Balneolaceae bacterium]
MTYQKFYTALIGIILTATIMFTGYTGIESNETQPSIDNHKVFELRTYTTHDGKLDDLHARFANHTMELFEKHGMENIGYWTPMDKENTLTYIIAHESREAAEASWDGFRNDPEWQEAFQASRTDGPLVESIESVFMTSTDYSPLK